MFFETLFGSVLQVYGGHGGARNKLCGGVKGEHCWRMAAPLLVREVAAMATAVAFVNGASMEVLLKVVSGEKKMVRCSSWCRSR